MDKEIDRMAAQWKHYNNHNNHNQYYQNKSNNYQQQFPAPNKAVDNKAPSINNG
jgi:hypothetical protein